MSKENKPVKQPDEGESDDPILYIVEKILASKVKNNKKVYLVKWQGYPDSDNTWEPAECFETCPDVLAEFEELVNSNQEKEQEQPYAIEIIGATDSYKDLKGLHYFIRFSDDTYELIKNTKAHRLCPHLLIDYLQTHLFFVSVPKGQEEPEKVKAN